MQRYGGSVKRQSRSNRKQVITAVTNRIVKQERVSTTEHPLVPAPLCIFLPPDPSTGIALQPRRAGGAE